jgi:two-component system nitrate/nitrite response regulator NarL
VITILLCRNTLMRAGIDHFLAGTRFAVVQETLDQVPDLTRFTREAPALVLICDNLTPDGYREALGRVKAQCPFARAVILADDLSPHVAFDLSREGLDGLCPPGMQRQALLAALELVMLGELFLPASVSLPLFKVAQSRPSLVLGSGRTPAAPSPGKLSARETQILRCLTQGASNKVIARQMGLAEATVKVHLKAILRKVRAENRTQAAMWANAHLEKAIELAS